MKEPPLAHNANQVRFLSEFNYYFHIYSCFQKREVHRRVSGCSFKVTTRLSFALFILNIDNLFEVILAKRDEFTSVILLDTSGCDPGYGWDSGECNVCPIGNYSETGDILLITSYTGSTGISQCRIRKEYTPCLVK